MARVLLVATWGAAFVGGCSDYVVTHSKLTDEVESAELTLTSGTSTLVLLLLEADDAALDAGPSSWVSVTVFAVRQDGLPIVHLTAGIASDELTVSTTGFLEIVVDGPFLACTSESATAFEHTWSNGTCAVTVPVKLDVLAGDISFQVAAHVELNFPRQDPPGTLTATVESAS